MTSSTDGGIEPTDGTILRAEAEALVDVPGRMPITETHARC